MDWERFLGELEEKAKTSKVKREELLKLAEIPTRYIPLMVYRAGNVKSHFFPEGLEFCFILNAKSGACSQDCKFCAQAGRYKTGAPVYPFVSDETVLKAAEFAVRSGARRFSLVLSGKAATPSDIKRMVKLAGVLKKEFPSLSLCFSAGTLGVEEIEELKGAGFDRLHHNLETSESFFPKIVSTHTWRERFETLLAAKEVGIEVCSGGLFGMGESWDDRVDLALTLAELGVNSVPLNFLIPIKGTPLGDRPLLTPKEALVIIALFRFANPKAEIRLAGGRERVLGDYLGIANFMVNAHMVGGYLTRAGRDPAEDRRMVEGMGLEVI